MTDTDIDGDGLLNDCDADDNGDGTVEGTDCNSDGKEDSCNIADGDSADCNSNGVPDECETCDTDVYVGFAAADGVDNFADIASAYDAVCAGGTVHVAAGTYSPEIILSDANVKDGVSITGVGAATILDGGVKTTHSVAVNGMAFAHLTIRHSDGTAGEGLFRMDNSGTVSTLTFINVVFDGQGIAGVHGILGQGLTGTFTVFDCTLENINNWAVLDSDSGGGAGEDGLNGFLFDNNTVRNNEGAIALRGTQVGSPTLTASITGNTITSMNGNYPGGVADYDGDSVADDLGWAGIEVNHVDTVTITGNTISDMRNGYSFYATGAAGDPFDGNYNVGGLGGQSLQIWKVNTLNMSGNTITNNFQGV